MAGISTKTVHEIFQTMDYGSSTTNTATAQVKHGLSWGNYHCNVMYLGQIVLKASQHAATLSPNVKMIYM